MQRPCGRRAFEGLRGGLCSQTRTEWAEWEVGHESAGWTNHLLENYQLSAYDEPRVPDRQDLRTHSTTGRPLTKNMAVWEK